MKKFLVFLVILLILAGTVFFFGWAQFAVPAGSAGVIRSKTHGIDPQIIKEGEFRWYWYKLIPTNAEIIVFTVKPVVFNISSSGSLPSGAVYASAAGIQADFSWNVTGELSFSVREDALPSLCLMENLGSQDDLSNLEESYSRGIVTLVLNRLNIIAQDEAKMQSLVMSGMLPELNSEIEAAFPDLEKISCVLRTIRYPDYDLYKSARYLYNEYLAGQQKVLDNITVWNGQNSMENRLRLDEMEKIGEVLTRYPVLLDYLALGKDFSSAFIKDE